MVNQALGNGAAVRQAGGHQKRDRLDRLQRARAVGGAHKDALASHHLRGHRQGGVAEVIASNRLTAALTRPQAALRHPGIGGLIEGLEVGEGLDGLSATLQRAGNGGGGPQHVDDDGRIRSTLSHGAQAGNVLRGVEIGDLHDRSGTRGCVTVGRTC